MSTESPAPRLIVSDADGTRWMLLLDAERAVGCLAPLFRDPAWDRCGIASKTAAIEFSWPRRRPGG